MARGRARSAEAGLARMRGAFSTPRPRPSEKFVLSSAETRRQTTNSNDTQNRPSRPQPAGRRRSRPGCAGDLLEQHPPPRFRNGPRAAGAMPSAKGSGGATQRPPAGQQGRRQPGCRGRLWIFMDDPHSSTLVRTSLNPARALCGSLLRAGAGPESAPGVAGSGGPQGLMPRLEHPGGRPQTPLRRSTALPWHGRAGLSALGRGFRAAACAPLRCAASTSTSGSRLPAQHPRSPIRSPCLCYR